MSEREREHEVTVEVGNGGGREMGSASLGPGSGAEQPILLAVPRTYPCKKSLISLIRSLIECLIKSLISLIRSLIECLIQSLRPYSSPSHEPTHVKKKPKKITGLGCRD